MVIKHAEGNNSQDLDWKFCVAEQNVPCWKKTKGATNKRSRLNQKKNHQMAKRSLGGKIKCCSKEERKCWF